MNKKIIYILLVVSVAITSQITGDISKLVLCGIFFVIAFVAIQGMKQQFSALVSIGLLCYCLAVTDNLYLMELTYTPKSAALWFVGNILMSLGIVDTVYKSLRHG